MSIGRGRVRSSQRAARSTIRRPLSSIHVCVSAVTAPSSASTCDHNVRMSNTSRAITEARAMSACDAPVSSRRRNMNVVPARSTSWFATRVAMISRRSRWRLISSAKRSGSGGGK